MTVTIGVPGKFQTAYHFARHLESRGLLERLVTPIPYGRTAMFGVSRERTRTVPPFAYWYHGFERYGPRRFRSLNQLAYSELYGRVIAQFFGDPSAYNGWSSVALEGIREARRRGLPTVLVTGSTHIKWQTDALEREFRRLKLDTPLTHPKLIERCEREYDEADLIVVPSQFAAQTFAAAGIQKGRVAVVRWAVAPVKYIRSEPRRGGAPRALFVGQVTARKGVQHLFEAVRLLPRPLEVRLVGPVDRRLVSAAGGLPAGVVAVGRLRGDALAAEYADADFFVLPSIEDGSALVIQEAMSAGLPVVASDCAGADDVVDGISGFVVPSGSPEALARRIEELADDPDLRERMGQAALNAVRAKDWDTYGEELFQAAFAPLLVGSGTAVA